MVMTSDELLRDLRQIEWLLAALAEPGGTGEEDADDVQWLRANRRLLSDILAVRRAQRGKKVVDLDLWRYGRAMRG